MPKKKTVADIRQTIADEQASDFLGEPVTDGRVSQDENPIEKKAKEVVPDKDVVETAVEAPKEVEKEVVVDADTFKKEIIDEIKQAIPQTPQETKEAKDAIDEYLETAEKEGRTPTYKEALKYLKDVAKNELKEEFAKEEEARRKQAQELKEKSDQEIAQREQEIKSSLEEEMNELISNGKIPAVKDANDPQDPGVRAQVSILNRMMEVNQDRVKNGQQAILSVGRIFSNYYKEEVEQPAGADAPISAGSRVAPHAQPDDEEMDYREIHNTSWSELMMEEAKKRMGRKA